MKNFDNVKFKWNFRSYQQRVLDNADKFLSDGKINIVAAPGSGKTILGLELIRRLNAPAIILSPTTTIRHQWGERFKEAFIDENENIDDYFSYDLNEITLVNSITYQALYSAMNKISVESEDETVDYSNIDLFKLIRSSGIKTICMDEAHHLQNEWEKALEKFIKGLDKDIKIISLTATPPYDAKSAEWNRYVTINGEIDDEIFVPELVKEKTLCPHQDYVYFSYPTKEEFETLKMAKLKQQEAVNEIIKSGILQEAVDMVNNLYYHDSPLIYENYSGITGLLIFADAVGLHIDKKMFRKLTSAAIIPPYKNVYGERGLNFILDSEIVIKKEKKEKLIAILKRYGLMEKKKVSFDFNDKLKRKIVSSDGKLNSIVTIAQSEYKTLQKHLRMLILTDFIRKESVNMIGTDTEINNISLVSIFEKLRKNTDLSLGVLSGSIVILPSSMEDKMVNEYSFSHELFKVNRLENTEYGIYNFKGKNKEKVDIVSMLFEKGEINVLIGTQSLLGEGWDSPCINSLILASYVGSFMLSNQMRGRAIRIYKKDPGKTSNIWHLVTLEPDYKFEENMLSKIQLYLGEDNNEIHSYDYDTLCRRFSTFVGPDYETKEIVNGIERIKLIKPPFDEEGIRKINLSMLEKASQRDRLTDEWKDATMTHHKLHNEIDVEKKEFPKKFTFVNILSLSVLMAIEALCLSLCIYLPLIFVGETLKSFASAVVIMVLLFIIVLGVFTFAELKIYNRLSQKKLFTGMARVLVKTLKDCDLISDSPFFKMNTFDKYSVFMEFTLQNATVHEQNIFNDAVEEMFSPIENPKYIMVRKMAFLPKYYFSFAVPDIISKADKAELFRENLNKSFGGFEKIYTYNNEGRKILIHSRNHSFISENYNKIYKRKRISKFD